MEAPYDRDAWFTITHHRRAMSSFGVRGEVAKAKRGEFLEKGWTS